MTNFKELLDAYSISQTSLARRLKIPLRTVQGWTLGERNPPDYVLRMIDFCLKKGADFEKENGSKSVVNR